MFASSAARNLQMEEVEARLVVALIEVRVFELVAVIMVVAPVF